MRSVPNPPRQWPGRSYHNDFLSHSNLVSIADPVLGPGKAILPHVHANVTSGMIKEVGRLGCK